MKYKEYQKLATRTCPDLGSEVLNLSHMVLGMNSEIIELHEAIVKSDKVNISEELSDMMWYLANYCTFRDYELDKLNKIDQEPDDVTLYISKLQDLVKKYLAYGKEIDRNKEKLVLEQILQSTENMYYSLEINISNSLQNNIDKLIVRYPDKFSTDNALNRDLESERKELEK